MKYLVQFDGTDPALWQEYSACSKDSAIMQALKGRITKETPQNDPQNAYVSQTMARHPNGTPLVVLKCKLYFKREEVTA